MNPADDDSGAEIAACFEMLKRCHRTQLRACGRYVRHIAMVEGAVVVVCATAAASAYVHAGTHDEPLHSVMMACVALNGATVLLALRNAFCSIRDGMAEAREVRAALRKVEADAAEFEAMRHANLT